MNYLEKSIFKLALLAMIFTGCSEEAAFVENQEKVSGGTSEDATVKVDANGNPILPGDDTTEGDREGNEDGGSSNGNTDDVNTGDDDDDDDDDGTGGNTDGGGTGTDDGGDGSTGGGDDTPKPEYKSATETFEAHLITTSNVTAMLDQPYLAQEVKLQRDYKDVARQYQQITRPTYVDQFSQGYPGQGTTESFNQLANRPLDILVVIDNSGSMKEEQAQMADKLQPLLTSVADTDWAIGVVTTDPSKTCLRELIKKGDANVEDKFRSAISAGTNGSGNERGVLMAVRSLAGSCLSSPWIRTDSTLAVLVVSDEDNCSNGGDCSGKDYREASYLYNYLNTIRQTGANAKVYGIFWHPSQDSTQCSTADYQANIYADLVTSTNGTWGSICDADYGPTLAAISQNIQEVLGSRFTLSKTPDGGTVSVKVNGVMNNNFSVTGKVVEFNPPPADGSTIEITYAYGAKPIVNSWVLRYQPVTESVSVKVDGVDLADSEYSVNLAARRVTLTATPAARASVQVTYKRNDNLNDTYSFVDKVKDGTLRAFVNSVETSAFTVSDLFGLKSVKFDSPPAESAMIDITYVQVGDEIVSYPFSAEYGTPVDLKGHNKADGKAVRVSYSSGIVTVNENDWQEGMDLVLTYDNVDRQEFEVPLPQMPITGSIVAKGGSITCKNSLVLNGQKVEVQGCNFEDGTNEIKVFYDFLMASYTEFEFKAAAAPAPGAYQKWQVYINDVETQNFSRSGSIITVNEALPFYSKVKVKLTEKK